MRFGSVPWDMPIPPHTPLMMRSFRDRYSLFMGEFQYPSDNSVASLRDQLSAPVLIPVRRMEASISLSPAGADTVPNPMGSYVRGDVLLAPVRFGRESERKIRPVVVMDKGKNGELFVYLVSSRPPSDSPWISLRMEDFAEGGLDMFSESYLLLSRICRISPADVIGKKGRLRPGVLEAGRGT